MSNGNLLDYLSTNARRFRMFRVVRTSETEYGNIADIKLEVNNGLSCLVINSKEHSGIKSKKYTFQLNKVAQWGIVGGELIIRAHDFQVESKHTNELRLKI